MSENKYLNSFTILSYNPNNVDVTFKVETLFINDDIWESDNQNSLNNETENNETENNDQQLTDEEYPYWIIDENGKNKIIYRKYI